jgi:hypothetical protein
MRAGVTAILVLALVACGGGGDDDAASTTSGDDDEDSSSSSTEPGGGQVVTASIVAQRIAEADGGCEDVKTNPEPQEGSTNSIVCTLPDGTTLTIDAFGTQDAFDAFVRLGETAGCGFYDDGTRVPYVAGVGELWTASLSIETNGDFDLEGYEAVAEAADAEVEFIEC